MVLQETKDLSDGESRFDALPPKRAEVCLWFARERDIRLVNRCPYTELADWTPDQFLNADGGYIICAVHGALFEIHSGRCIHGPCANQL